MTRTAKIYKAAVGGALALALIFTLAKQGYAQTTIPAPGFQPSGLAYDGTFLYVSELSGFRTIYKLNPTTGAVLGSFLAPSPAGFDGNGNPNDLVADGAGRLFVSDIGNIVYEIDATGTTKFNSFSLPFRGGAIAFDGTNLYIGDFDSSQVRVTDRFGNFIRTFDSGLRPAGMVFDPATGHLWVISELDMKVSEITTNGELIRSCDGPRDPGVQGLGGVTRVGSKLYIAEVSDPAPFASPDIPGTIFIVNPGTLTCNPPILADHFKCYKAEGKKVKRTVRLEDEFGIEPRVKVKEPELFCNPVSKNEEGIQNPAGHLTCYEIGDGGNHEGRRLRVRNQFGEQTLKVGGPKLLCVPSEKMSVADDKDDDEKDVGDGRDRDRKKGSKRGRDD